MAWLYRSPQTEDSQLNAPPPHLATTADGFRKQLVVLTSGGKVLALHNGDGRLLWSLDFGPAAAPRKLALWRLPHDMQHDTEARGGCGAPVHLST